MKKGIRLIKRAISLLLVIILSIESFAAIVSDNDGSAFITKAEFDSLKNDFQSQIDNYNTSIDSKIDGAIAEYLAGIKVAPKSLININSNDEQFMFMDPNQKNDYKTFQGSMGVELKFMYVQKRSNSSYPNKTAAVRWEAKANPVKFNYAICKDKYNDLWLYKDVEVKLNVISLGSGNYIDSIVDVSGRSIAIFRAQNATVNAKIYSTGAELLKGVAGDSIFLTVAARHMSGYIYYAASAPAAFTSGNALNNSVVYNDYKDEKIRVLSSAATSDKASSDLKKHIPAFDITKNDWYASGYVPCTQRGNSRYARTGSVQFTYAAVHNSYDTSWESSSNIGKSTTTWLASSTQATTDAYKLRDAREQSLLPNIKDVAWDESTNVKNSNGDKLKFNDGYLFLKNAPSNGEVECTVNFDEKTTKVLNCFITNKAMNLSNRDTTVKKIPITYNGTTYKDNASFKSGITQATFKFKVEKGLDYYFFGCHSDGSGPIFKFENDAWIVNEQ